ncbi:MAG: flavodoxin family protein [Promethearchaeota archaeon]
MTSKIAVVFYSLEGNTKFIAQTIQEQLGADLIEIKPIKEIDNSTSKKYMWGGRQAIMNEKPELLPYKFDASNYEIIFIGTPIWAWHLSPPVNSFIDKNSLTGKKIAVFASCGGSPKKAWLRIEKRLKKSEILGHEFFIEPLTRDKNEAANKAKQWASTIVETI